MDNIILTAIIIVVILFIYSRVLLRLRDGKITLSEFIFWTLLWAAVAGVTFFPQILSRISGSLGIGRGLDFVLPVALILAFYLIFRAYVKIEQVEQDLTRLTRNITLEELRKKRR